MRVAPGERCTGLLSHTVAWLGLLLLGASAAHASVAVLLEEPYGWFSHFSPSGHVAVYLDHVCAASPVKLRPCRAGESGVVISRYDGIADRDWVAIPLVAYLYSVGDADAIPVVVNHGDAARLRDAYRRRYLEDLAPDRADGSAPGGNWYELAGSAFDRTIYGFQVKSTPEQDGDLIAYLNDHPNRSDYNGAVRNCADFVRVTVNRFYPHAIRRNFTADLGLTSPKAVARGLVHYAGKHPESGFAMFQIAQLSGDLPRSHPAVTLTEGIVKEFGIPLTVVSPVTTGLMIAAYLGHGRFQEPTEAPLLNLRADISVPDALNLHPAMPREAGSALARSAEPAAAASTGLSSGRQAAPSGGGLGGGFSAAAQPVSSTWTGETPRQP